MPSLRKTDLIGLIGLVMLLVWTPVYYAQGDVAQDHATGTTFRLPMPRDGEVLRYDLTIDEGDGEVRTIPGILTVRFRAHDPIEWPHGAVAVVETARPHVYSDGVRVLVNQSYEVEREWLAAPDTAVWLDGEQKVQPWTADLHVWGKADRGGCSTLGKVLSQEIRYEPSTWRGEIEGMFLEDTYNDGCPTALRSLYGVILNQVHHDGERTLYSHHRLRMDRWYDQAMATGPIQTCLTEREDSPYLGTYWNGEATRAVDPFDVFDSLRTHPFTYACDIRQDREAWSWYSRDLPIPAGSHVRYVDASGTPLLTMRLLVGHHEPGGAPLFQTTADHDSGAPATDTPALKEDTHPLVHGRTLQEVHQAVVEKADTTGKTFLATADLVTFWWRAEKAPVPRPSGPPGLPVGGTAEPAHVERDLWHLIYRGPTGTMRAYEIRLQSPIPPQPNGVDFWDHCADEETHHWACGKVAQPHDLPFHPPHRLLRMPTAELQRHADALLDPSPGDESSFMFDPYQFLRGSEWSLTRYEDGRSTASTAWNTTTGALTSFAYPSEQIPLTSSALATTTMEGPQLIEPLARTAAWGGLFLVLVSLAVRLFGAVKSGTASLFIATLYAKIAQDRVLDHERREALMTIVRENPGLTLREAQDRLGYGWGSTVHHVETLVRNGLLVDLPANRKRHLFSPEVPLPRRRRIAALLDPELHGLLEVVERDPGLPQRALAERLARPESAISRNAARLTRLGLVERRRNGRSIHLFPADD